jgi:hypothetical protein
VLSATLVVVLVLSATLVVVLVLSATLDRVSKTLGIAAVVGPGEAVTGGGGDGLVSAAGRPSYSIFLIFSLCPAIIIIFSCFRF